MAMGGRKRGLFSQVCCKFELFGMLRDKRRKVIVVERFFLALAHVLVCHGLAGHPPNEVLRGLCHDQRGLRRHNSHPAERRRSARPGHPRGAPSPWALQQHRRHARGPHGAGPRHVRLLRLCRPPLQAPSRAQGTRRRTAEHERAAEARERMARSCRRRTGPHAALEVGRLAQRASRRRAGARGAGRIFDGGANARAAGGIQAGTSHCSS